MTKSDVVGVEFFEVSPPEQDGQLVWEGVLRVTGMGLDQKELVVAFKTKQQHELVAILSAGAGLDLEVKTKMQHEIVALAQAAKLGGGHLILNGLSTKQQHELVAIATAGKGHVTLKD
ncbi:hypothetical protein [Pseudomonas oryziphila]|uniref:Uncharacterized protein n=1 Tax=Pseudomonas entomophila TaxID=312306 RepID=A0A3Q8U0T6_9PSED|nr:hypothetical protein [Pseudomonas oryziphila]AZL68821.1 hypothetical protein EJA05_14245 [Pseudomonas oryziphila]